MKKLNKEAGLNSFVLLVGTGLQNVHMSIEALQRYQKKSTLSQPKVKCETPIRHTKHTQFLTFHRSDANLGEKILPYLSVLHPYCRSRRGDWQVEGDLQLLPGGVLLPRLRGGGLGCAGENGKSVFLLSHCDQAWEYCLTIYRYAIIVSFSKYR